MNDFDIERYRKNKDAHNLKLINSYDHLNKDFSKNKNISPKWYHIVCLPFIIIYLILITFIFGIYSLRRIVK